MLDQHYYASEKLREIESGRVVCAQFVEQPHGRPALAPLAGPVGRMLHRLGHRIETWATADSGELPEMELRSKAG